ncbi:DUF1054 family protein [Lactiplantibacillus mudanjiangensis]|uniref:UPF0637 protein MUDAN_MDHGFNIF_01472 n=1 Tax=Lactiplantibacillus mudanjiangensis TaxID=1296538 RepID=A0A660EA78_9LACO|nr:DUF1054 family protein [Lactiplantibacillus mudanjiangensis]VDG19172.1 hypothetical protein MUDAN_BIHEEGNE_01049 [Lactiplantibacillus mudanjiangensis]VDG25663.1 hypothetical protein MUDAN_IGPPGNFN_01215 [Lactiplantibacillus mudanjiangensis]VDG29940.1 hypothetical protein MUDAN_MDHGFNIF_01472 [Lactiplantibacillus mudanjiangensis]VDG33242.1 hypothetical protein MUDAN_DOGOELCO_02445 [Lactiplantibacillus mudanjiangensis]
MFTKSDFEIFDDPTLAGRMHLIKTIIDPKFEAIAPTVIEQLAVTGQPFYAHVAKHLRRFKNPPVDTWVAFSEDKRRYKALPHFELGFWPDRLFIYVDILDESKAAVQAQVTPDQLLTWYQQLPADYVISNNHGVATTNMATPENIVAAIHKFGQTKHSELVAGRSVPVDSPLFDDEAALTAFILATVNGLLPIYTPIMAATREK